MIDKQLTLIFIKHIFVYNIYNNETKVKNKEELYIEFYIVLYYFTQSDNIMKNLFQNHNYDISKTYVEIETYIELYV